ncbi:MAG: hypothetical protein P8X57_10835, partial [Cyclobacteriaceae bacterium]
FVHRIRLRRRRREQGDPLPARRSLGVDGNVVIHCFVHRIRLRRRRWKRSDPLLCPPNPPEAEKVEAKRSTKKEAAPNLMRTARLYNIKPTNKHSLA